MSRAHTTGKSRDPKALGARCKRCPFAEHGMPDHPVLGEGPLDAVGVLVGEGPGRDEEARGRPFVGATGQKLDDALRDVGLPRSSLFIVNATCCRPPPSKTHAMLKKAVDRCRPALIAQLRKLGTSNFIAMGKWACYALTGSVKGLKNKRGFVREFSLEVTEEVEGKIYEQFLQRIAKKKGSKLRAKY